MNGLSRPTLDIGGCPAAVDTVRPTAQTCRNRSHRTPVLNDDKPLTPADVKYFNAPRYLLRRYCVRKLLGDRGSGAVLDIGCGAGDLSYTLSRAGFRVTGIDFSDAAIEACKLRFADAVADDRLSFRKDDLYNVNEKFDVIVMMEVLEHIEDDLSAMQAVHRLLAPGGTVLLSVPANSHWYGPYDRYVGHIRRYNRDDLESVFVDAGFELEAMWSYGVPLANLTEFVRNRLYANKPVIETEQATKRSGINRALEYPIRHLSNDIVLFPFLQLQRLFFSTNLGTGLIVKASKREAGQD